MSIDTFTVETGSEYSNEVDGIYLGAFPRVEFSIYDFYFNINDIDDHDEQQEFVNKCCKECNKIASEVVDKVEELSKSLIGDDILTIAFMAHIAYAISGSTYASVSDVLHHIEVERMLGELEGNSE